MGLRQELADVRPHWITRESAARHRSENAAMARRTTRRFRKRDRTLKRKVAPPGAPSPSLMESEGKRKEGGPGASNNTGDDARRQESREPDARPSGKAWQEAERVV